MDDALKFRSCFVYGGMNHPASWIELIGQAFREIGGPQHITCEIDLDKT